MFSDMVFPKERIMLLNQFSMAFVLAVSSTSYASPQFYGFSRDAVGGRSLLSANDISAGGFVAMSGSNGAVWHPELGFVHEFIPDDAIAVSDNGNIVATQGGSGARIWTADNGFQDFSNANNFIGGISGDGVQVVGSNTGSDQAFIWDESSGYRLLGGIQGAGGDSTARAISSDGQTIVGSSWNGTATTAVTISTRGEFTDLGILNGYSRAEAQGVSSDGRYVVGVARNGLHFGAFRWDRESEELQNLGGALLGLAGFNAFDVSDTGVVVGQSYDESTGVRTAMIYDDDNGWRTVAGMLAAEFDIVVDPRWQLENVYSISHDGSMIAGSGLFMNASGGLETSAWVAVIPSPGSFSALAICVLTCMRRCRD